MDFAAPHGDLGERDRRAAPPAGLRGWVLVYMVGLALQAVHGLVLTVGAIVIFSHPGLAHLTSFVPLGALLFYVGTNLTVAVYTVKVLQLMARRRGAAIASSIALNCLTVTFLLVWHLLGEKSPLGTIIDIAPGLVGLAYVLCSKRVRATFIRPRSETVWAAEPPSP
jgi:hypothetical protein